MSGASRRDLSVPLERVSLEVTPEFDGSRLDHFLRRQLPWRSRSQLQGRIRQGRVLVNGERMKPGRRVFAGNRVEIALDSIDPSTIRHHEIPLHFLYEDEHIALLDKQPGIIVHPVSYQLFNTLINALHYHYRVRRNEPDVSPRLGHRLDKETSGVLLVAKNREVRRVIQEIFERHRVRKQYLALVHGIMPDGEPIDEPIATTRLPRGGVRMVVREDGAPSRTAYEVVECFERHSLVRLEPETGRTHQLRVHLAHRGHPILADSRYGRESALAALDGRPVLDRQALHSSRLVFPHPVTGETLDVRAPLPPDMSGVREALRAGLPLAPAERPGATNGGARDDAGDFPDRGATRVPAEPTNAEGESRHA